MLDREQAQTVLADFYPSGKIKAWSTYRNFYLFHVEHPDPEEKDLDPFFSVDQNTGEVRDFSFLTDGNLSELVNLEWNDIN